MAMAHGMGNAIGMHLWTWTTLAVASLCWLLHVLVDSKPYEIPRRGSSCEGGYMNFLVYFSYTFYE